MTYPRRLDAHCAERGFLWRAWDGWRRESDFERRLHWQGEGRDHDDALIAEVPDSS